jgi:preprotein translocase subunit SecA
MNVQRMVIYEQRRSVLEGADLSEEIRGWMDELVARLVFEHTQSEYREEWDLDSLFAEMQALYETEIAPDEVAETTTREELIEEFQDDAQDAYDAKVEEYGAELMREVERYLVLQVVDVRWREHLESMEYLRDGIHLRAMAQKDPLSEYRSEGHGMFEELTGTIQEEIVRYLLRIQIERPPEQGELEPGAAGPNGGPDGDNLTYEHESMAGSDAIRAAGGGGGQAAPRQAMAGAMAGAGGGAATTVSTGQRVVAEADRVGRNDPCPCGSGKKYKKCHGA